MNDHPSKTSRTIDPVRMRKVLLVRNDNIGDVVCTTPCFEAVKRRYPSAEVAVLVNRVAEQVVRGNPWLDRVYVYDKAKHGRYRNPLVAWWRQARVMCEIRRAAFNVVVGVRSTFSVPLGWLVYASGAPIRVGVRPTGKKKRYGFFYNVYADGIDQQAHEVDRALALLAPLGVRAEEKRLHFPISSEDLRFAQAFLDGHGLAGDRPVVVNYGGRREENRWWPQDKYVQLIRRLQDQAGVKVVLTNGPGEEDEVERIRRILTPPPMVYPPGLKRFAALLTQSSVFVSVQGGPTHVAAAVGTATVAIFDKSDPRVWRPWGDNHRVVKAGDHPDTVGAEEVYDAVVDILARSQRIETIPHCESKVSSTPAGAQRQD